MNKRDSNSISPWQEVQLKWKPEKVKLNDTIYDALIIGAGITGLTTALLLQKAGKNCIIAEANTIGFGATGGTTAHLNTFLDASYADIENDFGKNAAKLMAEALIKSMDTINNFIDSYAIDCDFESKDAYVFSENSKETHHLAKMLASSRKAGLVAVEERDNKVPIPFQMVIKYADQAQFHPLKYINGLAKAFTEAGGIIYENTFISKSNFDDGIHTAHHQTSSIKAKNLIYATHIPPGINILDFKCAPYRSYVLGIKLKNEDYPEDLIYDMQEPYHYFRTHIINGQKYLLLGGEDHKTGHGDPQKALKSLEDYARKYYYVESIPYQWSSQFYVPSDGLPYIGLLPGGDDQTYVATGYNGTGMTLGTLAGKIISDHILGLKNSLAELLSPARIKPIVEFEDFVKENADVIFHYVADRFSIEVIDSLKELKSGTGTIVNYNENKLAVYKDEQGVITALNPVCTHAKCIVNYNAAEKSWDCPCHGGRFDVYGRILTGPPRQNLVRIELNLLLK